MMNDEIIIGSNKTKTFFLLIGGLLFVILGIWFLDDPQRFANSSYRPRSAFFIEIFGFVSVVFFGACSVLCIKNLIAKKSGLIFNQFGIQVNSAGPSIGLIIGDDITGIKTVEFDSQRFIMIEVSNPDHYINRSKNRIKKMAMKANYTKYGTPISISAYTLKVNFEVLIKIFEKQYAKNIIN